MSQIKKWIKKLVLLCYRVFATILPVNSGVIVFESNLGRNYTGNPRAIYEKMVELGLDKKYRCYYILDCVEDYRGQIPGRIRLIRNARLRFYFIMAIAGVWVMDTRLQNYMKKRKKCLYIQTWHGTPLKKLGLDLEHLCMAGEETLSEYQEEFRINSATWDYLVSQNPFSTGVFRRAFDFHGFIIPCGYPRNDRLFEARGETAERSRKRLSATLEKLGLPQNKKILLYAPTWRDDAYYDKASYRFETRMDFEKMKQALGGEYILLAKFHYMVREKEPFDAAAGFLYPVDAKVDIADLYPLADVLITDYSSVMFDYCILKRPMIFYAYDKKHYKDEVRGFYFDFEETVPGPVAETTEEVIAAVRRADTMEERQKYEEKYQAFCAAYNAYETGSASLKILQLIEEKHGNS